MKFANSPTRPTAQFCRDPDCFASFGARETLLDIDVGLVFVALKEFVKRLSYCVLIVVHLGSVDVGEAGIESGKDLSCCILAEEGRTGTKCEIGNTTSVVKNSRGRHGWSTRGSRGVPKSSEVDKLARRCSVLLTALLHYY